MKVLPFYTSTGMRDAERVTSQDALLCPTYKFLPFQIQRTHSTDDTFLSTVKIVDCDGAETDVFDYFLGSQDLLTGWSNFVAPFDYETFDTSGSTILTAIETGVSGVAYSNEFALATGDSVVVTYARTLNSGAAPQMYLGGSGGGVYSPKITTTTSDTVLFTATGNSSGNVSLIMQSTGAASYSATFSRVKRSNLVLNKFTSYDFFTYNGEPLSTTLPYGVYYIEFNDGNTEWYSEWFNVQDIQPQIITGYSFDNYDTFTTSGANVTSAINLAGAASANSNQFTARNGEIFIYTYNLTLNSGQAPNARLARSGGIASNNPQLEVGLHEVELTSNFSGTVVVDLANSAASNYSLSMVSLRRKWGDYVHLEYTNTKDFNNGANSIYYAGGFTQQAYLRAYENLPSHESIDVGSDKDGEFVAEKIVRKYSRSIVSYESRSMYNALSLLKHHDTIKILDEVGNEYTPSVGNVDVTIDWNTFDTGSLRIVFNEGGDVWTNSLDNIT